MGDGVVGCVGVVLLMLMGVGVWYMVLMYVALVYWGVVC